MNWSQLCTVLWLRWRLTRNQWARRGAFGAVIAIIVSIATVLISIGAGVGGILGGAKLLSEAPPLVMLLVWDAIVGVFLFVWFLGVVTEIQRSESIDLARLMHLPVSLRGVFVVNYLASHLSLSFFIFLPGTMGLCLGLLWVKGPMILFLVPLVFCFLFMVTAWTYCVRGWLVALMVNPRRRRSVMVMITLGMVLMGQLPNLYFNVYLRHAHKQPAWDSPARRENRSRNPGPLGELPPEYISSQKYVPLLWLPNGAKALAEGNAWPAVWGSLGAFLLGVAGLGRAYRSTIRFYRGEEKSKALKPREATTATAAPQAIFLERKLPALPEEVTALALASLRCLSRAPEIKMALVSNVVVLIILAFTLFSRISSAPGETSQLFLVTGAVAFTFFGLLQLMFNQFGFDRDGFRALVLLPAPRRHVLVAKNLAIAPMAFMLGLVALLALKFVAHFPLLAIFAGFCQLVGIFLALSIAGNFLSITVPYRITAGSLKPTKNTSKVSLMILLTHLLFPVMMAPVFIPATLAFVLSKFGGWPGIPVDALFSIVLLAVMALLYWMSLNSLGGLMERREKSILLVVSQEVE